MTVFGSVIYASALNYLEDFIESINKQNCENFDVMFIVDDIDINEVNKYITKIHSHKVFLVDRTSGHNTPAELRVCLIAEAKVRGYELLVIGDCDDTFGTFRIQRIQETYLLNPQYAFFYNDLMLQDGTMVMEKLPEQTSSLQSVLQCNYLGLSNSAINLNRVTMEWIESLKECESFVFDWYLFSRLLISEEIGCYVENAPTFYRIYESNFVGINQNSQKMLEKELIVKKCHYQSLSKYSMEAQQLFEKIKDLTIKDVTDTKTNTTSFWWSNICL